MMGFWDFFRRKSPIRDTEALADFIDKQAAFLVQKGIYDYSRARSGHFAKVMLADKGFQGALNRSRWRAFPLGLAMVGETVEAVLAPQAVDDRRTVLDSLIALVLSVYDRHPRPEGLTPDEWQDAREELKLNLERLSTHPPKRIIDIPESFADRYFAMMPFDKPFLTPDAPTARGFMQLQLIAVHEQLRERMNASDMIRKLRGA
jgi:hypothetical protein